jgi:hypothetical protein
LSRLFGDLAPIASGVVEEGVQESELRIQELQEFRRVLRQGKRA